VHHVHFYARHPLPLQGIYVLDTGDEIEITPLLPKDVLLHLLPHWYGAMLGKELLRAFGLGSHFRECMRLVSRVPAYLLKRPASLEVLADVAQAVEQHALCRSEPIGA
jgi:hypothetical protein